MVPVHARMFGALGVVVLCTAGGCASITGLDQFSRGAGGGADSGSEDARDAIDATTDDGAHDAGRPLDATSEDDAGNDGDDDAGPTVSDGGGDGAAGGPCSASQPCATGCCSGGTCVAGIAAAACGAAGAACTDCTTGAKNACISGACAAAITSATAYACVTTLPAPSPVCDTNHAHCLCTKDSECNSAGVATGGGCASGASCATGACTGETSDVDLAGCSVVGTFCNLGGVAACPANTACEGSAASGWNVGHQDLCGNALQCCWCTSDSACGVGHACINDATQKQCAGHGPCTGTGTNWDGMHCALESPGIPMCSLAASCARGNCSNVTTPGGSCSAGGTPCWCASDAQCTGGRCATWAGCAAGACTGAGAGDAFHCTGSD